MSETQTQTHCPKCGLHRDAVLSVVEDPTGAWTCASCDRNPPREPTEAMVVLPCPRCGPPPNNGCFACGGLGSVRVAMSALRVYDPSTQEAGPQMLTEGPPAGELTEDTAG